LAGKAIAISIVAIGAAVVLSQMALPRLTTVLGELGTKPPGWALSVLDYRSELPLLPVPGLLLGAFVVYLFRTLIVHTLGVPFLYPPLPELLAMLAAGILLALAGMTLAALLPAWRISRRDAALAMQSGGVGYYAESNFVHIDTGNTRSW
jgi:hypothetical protein